MTAPRTSAAVTTHAPDHRATPVPATGVLLAAAATTALAGTVGRTLAGTRAGRSLERPNFHGRTVSLRGGLAAAAGALATGVRAGAVLDAPGGIGSAGGALAAVVAASSGATAGLVDDLDAGAHDGDAPAKGLRGHLGALAHGRVTTGALKIAVIGSGGLVSGALLARWRRTQRAGGSSAPLPGAAGAALDAATSAVVIASWANVINLLDLRPGRALKATALVAAPLVLATGCGRDARGAHSHLLAAGALGTAAAALPEDLAETTMLGDTGANALGALLGTAIAAHPSRLLRAGAAVAGTGLVLASEKVSFSRVIASHTLLARLDGAGRQR